MINNICITIVLYILLFLYLVICTIKDFKTQTISRKTSLVFACILLLVVLFKGDFSFIILIMGLIPGLLLMIIGFITKESIGYGDGIVTMIVGLAIGPWQTVLVCLLSFVLAALTSIVILIKGHSKNTSIPFVPFILCSFILINFLNLWEVL